MTMQLVTQIADQTECMAICGMHMGIFATGVFSPLSGSCPYHQRLLGRHDVNAHSGTTMVVSRCMIHMHALLRHLRHTPLVVRTPSITLTPHGCLLRQDPLHLVLHPITHHAEASMVLQTTIQQVHRLACRPMHHTRHEHTHAATFQTAASVIRDSVQKAILQQNLRQCQAGQAVMGRQTLRVIAAGQQSLVLGQRAVAMAHLTPVGTRLTCSRPPEILIKMLKTMHRILARSSLSRPGLYLHLRKMQRQPWLLLQRLQLQRPYSARLQYGRQQLPLP